MAVITIPRGKAQKKLLDHYIENGFEDPEDVLFYTKEFLGFNYPRKTYCSHHTAPSKILSDIYFELVDFIFIWANRTGGKTRLVANLNHLDSLFKGPIEIVNAGAAREQADKGYEYFVESFKHPLLKQYLPDPLQKRSRLTNESTVAVITGSKKGFNGPHPQKVRIDEVELMDWDVLMEGLNMSRSKNRIKSQDVLSSTRKVSHGTVQRLINEKEDRRLTIMSYCIWDIVERCERKCHGDKKYGDCPIFHLCGGKAHDAPEFGYFPIEDLVKKASNLTKSVFEAQWENKRPSDAPTVYGEYFDREKHVKTWEQLYQIFKVDEFKHKRIPKDWTRISGIDFGSKFVFLTAALEPRTRTWILFYEYYCNIDRRLKEHANFIKTSQDYDYIDTIFADSAAKQDRIELRGHGIRTKKSIKGEDSILLGIDEIKLCLQNNPVLDRPKFYIVEGTCPNTVLEFETWAWELEKDGTPNTEQPVDRDNHCMDALRYIIFSYGRTGGNYEMGNIEGV